MASIFSKTKYTETMDVFIKANSTIPCSASKTITITPNDKSLIILEGDNEMASENEVLHEIVMQRGLKPGEAFDVKFTIDANNILTVTVISASAGDT